MVYRVVRWALRLALSGFFRRVTLQGAEHIPSRGPVLFVANHTNAFVDPLIVLTGQRRRVTLTAKSTLAGNPLLAPVIKGLGVVLLHRTADRGAGADPRRNEQALAACVSVLRDGGAVFLFPEGVSHSDVAMRPFRTGAARLVSDFLGSGVVDGLASGTADDLRIVPVGLHYTKKDGWRSEAIALIGAPVSASAWVDRHRAATRGESVDVATLTSEMRRWVEELTANFASEEERTLLSCAERLLAYRPDGPGALDSPDASDAWRRVERVHRLQRGAHELRARDPDRFDHLADGARNLDARLTSLGVGAGEVSLSLHPARAALFVVRELELLIVGAPVAFVGWVLHLAPLTLTRSLVARMSEDEDHPASNAVFLSIPIFGAWWLALAVVAGLVSPSPVVAAMAAPVVAWYTAAVHLRYRDRAGSVVRRIRTFFLWLRRPGLRQALEADVVEWHAQVRAVEAELPPRASRTAPESK